MMNERKKYLGIQDRFKSTLLEPCDYDAIMFMLKEMEPIEIARESGVPLSHVLYAMVSDDYQGYVKLVNAQLKVEKVNV